MQNRMEIIMSNNKPTNNVKYSYPGKHSVKDWDYLGQGKANDPTMTDKDMKGNWTISYKDRKSNSFSKFNQNK